MDQFPAHWGTKLTSSSHSKAEGLTDLEKIKLPSNFVVCITGASTGVGYAMALAFARAGAVGIVVAARSQSGLDKVVTDLKQINPNINVLAQTCDVTNDADVQRLASLTLSHFRRLDAVIANAGIISDYITKSDGKLYLPSGMCEDPSFERVIETNMLGTYRTAKHFIPLLQHTRDGVQAFVAITSVASHIYESSITPVAYNVSKLAINRIVEHIHSDYHENDGIQAFAVQPGSVLTPQTVGHRNTQLGKFWDSIMVDDPGLGGGFLTWLLAEKRPWLSGRFISSNWDVDQLIAQKDEILEKDKLKFRMSV